MYCIYAGICKEFDEVRKIKGKDGRQAALHSLRVTRCAGAQTLGHGGHLEPLILPRSGAG